MTLTMDELMVASQSALTETQNEVANAEKKGYEDDPRFWKPSRDNNDTGRHIIRFLPSVSANAKPVITTYSFNFKVETAGSTKWYIKDSLTTLGQKDPANEVALAELSKGKDAKKKLQNEGRTQKTHYIANILVVEDQFNPQNNGKVMLFKFGKQIFEKISDLTSPQFEGKEAINIYDWKAGNNFELLIKSKGDFVNYESSNFDHTPSAVGATDEEILRIANSCVDLGEFLNPEKFESYEDLKAKYYDVMGWQAPTASGGDSTSAPVSFTATNVDASVQGATETTTVSAEASGEGAPGVPSSPTPPTDSPPTEPTGDGNETPQPGGIDKAFFDNAKGDGGATVTNTVSTT